MSDDELIRIATQDAYGLTPEAIEVVKAEIQKRELDENISKGVEAQNKEYTIEEVDAYCDLVSNLACPSCGGTCGSRSSSRDGSRRESCWCRRAGTSRGRRLPTGRT